MNLFTSLMPGIRQLRTPLAVGALWLATLYLAFSSWYGEWIEEFPILKTLSGLLLGLPELYLVGALTFFAYVFGSVVQGLSASFATSIRVVVRGIERMIKARRGPVTRRWRWRIEQMEDKYATRGVIMDAVSERFSSGGLPYAAYLSFPFDIISNQLESMSLQLWHKAPDQYQESDRLRAEAAFRVGISLPLAVIGALLGAWTSPWAAVPFLVASFVLVMQSRNFDRERRALLANALYQGLISNATLEATVRILAELEVAPKMGRPEWHAAAAIAVGRAGDVEAAGTVVLEGASEISDEVDFGTDDWESAAEAVTQRVRRVYSDNGEEEHLEYFDRMVAQFKEAAARELGKVREEGMADSDSLDIVGRRAWRRDR